MRIFKKIFFWFFIISGIVFICLSAYVQIYGKSVLVHKIKEKYGLNVSIGYLLYSFPSGLYAVNVEVQDLFEAKDVIAQFDIKYFFNKKIKIKNIETLGGNINISDKYLPKGLSLTLRDVDFKAYDFILPIQKQRTRFSIKGKVQDKKNIINGNIYGDGWIDIFSKDMDAKVKIVNKQGKVDLFAKLISKNDDLNVKGNIDLSAINRTSNGENKQINSKNIILSVISKLGIGINAKFSFNTKMSMPNIKASNVSFSGDIIKKN